MEAEQSWSNMIDYIRSFYKEEILFAFLSKHYKYATSLNYFLLELERSDTISSFVGLHQTWNLQGLEVGVLKMLLIWLYEMVKSNESS